MSESPLFDPNHPIWQPMSFRQLEAVRVDMGPLSMIISRRDEEWRFRYRIAPEAMRDALHVSRASLDDTLDIGDTIERVAAHDVEESREIQLMPLLADRFVSARPETPVTIAPGSYAAMYVTTPLWLRVVRLPDRSTLLELPSFRPVDTWLGPATGEGPLGYASRVNGRLNINQLRLSPMRAISKVTLKNSGNAPLLLPRVVIPTPELRLFIDEQGRHWSNEVVITRGRDGQLSEVTYLARTPEEAGKTTIIAEPRANQGNVFARAMSSILGV